MLVTKLKNSRKCAVFVMVFTLFLCAGAMVGSYPMLASRVTEGIREDVEGETLDNLREPLQDGLYFLYNQAYGTTDQSELMSTYDMDEFLLLRKYMEYEIFDFEGEALLGESSDSTVKKLVSGTTDYAVRVAIVVDADSGIQSVQADGTALDERRSYLLEQSFYSRTGEDGLPNSETADEGQSPAGFKAVFAMTEDQLTEYIKVTAWDGTYAEYLCNNAHYLKLVWGIALFAGILGFLIACCKGWRTHEWKLFRAPLELVILVWLYAISLEGYYATNVWQVISSEDAYILSAKARFTTNLANALRVGGNVVMWMAVFGTALWGAACLQEILVLKKAYLKERTVCAALVRWSKKGNEQYGDRMKQGANDAAGFFRRWGQKIGHGLKSMYDELLHMDLTERSNKTIVKALVINFILLWLVSRLWAYSIIPLILYTVVLFLVLRRYARDVKRKYALLLEAANLLAEGNLDAPIEGDLGVFNPMKTEIQKIRKGFKKAVEEEVKSERMKTELITNVSHDLKTPLTAIITYIDLLKSEKSPEKQKEYLEVLERKSQRLKVLIEDLFEISKATSRNVTMNFMKVDIAGLLKQVELECEEKIREAGLEFRWNLPEEKVVMLLDSQKTYRIFENLLVNITKYAMPHTRVYVNLVNEESRVMIQMKNVSAAELNFDSEEITDRFVRGDASRNTEGAGLGLAIAKSFTELQYGTLQVSTEADLFKVEIRLPKRKEDVVK